MCMCKPYSTLLVTLHCYTAHCALRRKDSHCALACRFCVSRKDGTGGGRLGCLQGDMHMVAARLGCQSTMVETCGLILALATWTGSENTTLTLQGFISGREGSLDTERVYDNQKC